MAFVDWNESYSVKIADIDQQHKQLINIINNLHEVMKTGGAPAKLAPIVNELVSYTHYHFSFEKKMLESTAYPTVADHKKVHQSMVAQVENFRDMVADGKSSAPLKLMAFLKDWLTSHILQTDMRYSSHVTARRAA
jgi:hemerythrin